MIKEPTFRYITPLKASKKLFEQNEGLCSWNSVIAAKIVIASLDIDAKFSNRKNTN